MPTSAKLAITGRVIHHLICLPIPVKRKQGPVLRKPDRKANRTRHQRCRSQNLPSRLANLPNKHMNNTNTLPASILFRPKLRSAGCFAAANVRRGAKMQDTANTQVISQIGICRVRMCESYNTSQSKLGTQHTPATLSKNRDVESGKEKKRLRQPYQSMPQNGLSTVEKKTKVRTSDPKTARIRIAYLTKTDKYQIRGQELTEHDQPNA